MKYLLKILGLSLLSIPFFIWHSLIVIWTFRTEKFVSFSIDVADTIEHLYRRAFPIRPNRKKHSTF